MKKLFNSFAVLSILAIGFASCEKRLDVSNPNYFTDDQMAAAMIDRLVHHGHLLLFEGNSYRMEHALMKQTARQPRVGTLSRDRPLDVKRTGSP